MTSIQETTPAKAQESDDVISIVSVLLVIALVYDSFRDIHLLMHLVSVASGPSWQVCLTLGGAVANTVAACILLPHHFATLWRNFAAFFLFLTVSAVASVGFLIYQDASPLVFALSAAWVLTAVLAIFFQYPPLFLLMLAAGNAIGILLLSEAGLWAEELSCGLR